MTLDYGSPKVSNTLQSPIKDKSFSSSDFYHAEFQASITMQVRISHADISRKDKRVKLLKAI